MSEHIGYIRVSSEGQNIARQLDGIHLDRRYIDKLSGALRERPQLDECLAYIRKGDTLHVHAMDRLARSLRDLLDIIETTLARGVSVHIHAENLLFTPDNTNPHTTMMMQLLGAFAQYERSISKNRQREGIAKAQESNKHMGRPTIDYSLHDMVKTMKADGMSVTYQYSDEILTPIISESEIDAMDRAVRNSWISTYTPRNRLIK